MPWVRIDENAMDHPKIGGLPDGAFRLWVEGLAYCQRFLTDGVMGERAVRSFRHFSKKRQDALVVAGLWDAAAAGFTVHDYLDWNESREDVQFARECAQRRTALLRDPALRQAIRERDSDLCRYCGEQVRWNDRKGPLGGTYDHVDPMQGNSMDNLVVCCRSCNSSKKRRTPAEASMPLLPPPSRFGSRSDLDQIKHTTSGVVCRDELDLRKREGGSGETDPVQRFVARHTELYRQFCGVGYIGNPQKDYQAACQIVQTFPDPSMQDAILAYGLNDPDPFMAKDTRTIPKIACRASKYAEELKAKKLA